MSNSTRPPFAADGVELARSIDRRLLATRRVDRVTGASALVAVIEDESSGRRIAVTLSEHEARRALSTLADVVASMFGEGDSADEPSPSHDVAPHEAISPPTTSRPVPRRRLATSHAEPDPTPRGVPRGRIAP